MCFFIDCGLDALEQHVYATWRCEGGNGGNYRAIALQAETRRLFGRPMSHQTAANIADRAHHKLGGTGSLARDSVAEQRQRLLERGRLVHAWELHGDTPPRPGVKLEELEEADRALDQLVARYEAGHVSAEALIDEHARIVAAICV